jgi:D-3-phosphoglycerate dehydrogenase
VKTTRGALADEEALVEALRLGHICHTGLDVFAIEPMRQGRILTTLYFSHSTFRFLEASDNLIGAALDHCRCIAAVIAERDAKDAEGCTYTG